MGMHEMARRNLDDLAFVNFIRKPTRVLSGRLNALAETATRC